MPIHCDVPGAICKNVCSAGATDAEINGKIKYWLKFAADETEREMAGRNRGWMDMQDGPLLRVLAEKRYVIISFGLAGNLSVGVL